MKNLIALLIIVASSALVVYFPHIMINPGELVQSHQDIKTKCNSCHDPFWGISTQKCIVCHKLADIGKDDTAGAKKTGKLPILFHQNLKDQNCTACHTDHKGTDPSRSKTLFDHNLLSGTQKNNCITCHNRPSDKTHKQLSTTSCVGCHNTKDWKSGVVFNHDLIEGTDKNNCSGCHQPPVDKVHKLVPGNCTGCHNTQSWKSGTKFNHEMISGADKTNCTGCHQIPGDTFHKSLKDNCTKCHSTNAWKPANFDHSNYFPLDGHHNAECITCHTSNNYKAYTCYGCHEHSESRIIGKHREHGITNLTNCISCHKNGSEHEGGEHEGGGEGEHEGGGDDD